jgi:Tfp pilus assembly protein PilX
MKRRSGTAGTRRRFLGGEKGSGLVMSLMATAMFAIVSVTIYSTLHYLSRESIYYMRAAQAQEEAEAGLEDALLQLRLDQSWHAGFKAKPLGDGSYTVTLSADIPPTVTSTGYSAPISGFGDVARTIQVKANYYTGPNTMGSPYHVGWQPGSWTQLDRRQ